MTDANFATLVDFAAGGLMLTAVLTDIEAIYTYEGTEHVQSLIVGRDITGVGAFT